MHLLGQVQQLQLAAAVLHRGERADQLANAGAVSLDGFLGGDGGSSLTVGGTLTNTGELSIGTDFRLSVPTKVTAAFFEAEEAVLVMSRS